MTTRQQILYRWSIWAETQELCLDQIVRNDESNPYLDDRTRLAFDAWMDGRRSAIQTARADVLSGIAEGADNADDRDFLAMVATIIKSNDSRLAIDALSLAGLGE